MTQKTILFLIGLAAVTPCAYAQGDTLKLNAGLEATILQLARAKDHTHLTVAFKLVNKGPNTVQLLHVDVPTATDNAGVAFNHTDLVGGIANCANWPEGGRKNEHCLGIPEKNNTTVPLQSFTILDPNQDSNGGITVNFRAWSDSRSEGPLIAFTAKMYYRVISDPLKDDTLSDAQKYKQFRLMTLSFPPRRVTDAE